MKSFISHDHEAWKAGRAREEAQGAGRHTFDLSWSAVFLPLRMVADGLQERVKTIPHGEARGVTWIHVHLEADEPEEVEPRYINSGTGAPVRREIARVVRVKAEANVWSVDRVKVEARCHLYRHPEQDHGWEAGEVELTWCWLFGDPEVVRFRFVNGWNVADMYVSSIQPAQ